MKKEILSLETAKKLADYEKLKKENEELEEQIAKLKVEKNITKMKNGALKKLYDDSVSKVKVRELISHYKNEIESENDLLEQGRITEKSYKNRVNLYNNYIHILEKLLKEE